MSEITLISSDNKKIKISKEAASLSALLKESYELDPNVIYIYI